MVRNICCIGALGLAGVILSGCVEPDTTTRVQSPPPVISSVASNVPQPSATSLSLKTYYNRLQNEQFRQGLLRSDSGEGEGPISRHQIKRNFLKIALHRELSDASYSSSGTEATLSRWEEPIRMSIEFGASVPQNVQRQDKAETKAFARRLSGLTGHKIYETSPANANFRVLFLSEDDKRAMGAEFAELFSDANDGMADFALSLPRSVLCFARAFEAKGQQNIEKTVVVIRAEHPDFLRKSCIHEELAQGMGLYNDSPEARPSIFNDNEEFGLLTHHDELLLKILYDDRLQPGMNKLQVKTQLPAILDDLVGGPS